MFRGQVIRWRNFVLNSKLKTVVMGLVLAGFSGPAFAAGDAVKGAKVFKKCKACHVADSAKNKVGPSLQGVLYRKPGTAAGYTKYSSAMVAFGEGRAWDSGTLDAFLTKPKAVVPGTKMSFGGLRKAQDRADVIAYLTQNSQ